MSSGKKNNKSAHSPTVVMPLSLSFYGDGIKSARKVAIIAITYSVIMTLLCLLVVLRMGVASQVAFPLYAQERLFHLPSLQSPVYPDHRVSQYAVNALLEVFNYGYLDLFRLQKGLNKYFTPEAAKEFVETKSFSDVYTYIVNNEDSMKIDIKNTPIFFKSKVENGRYAWSMEVCAVLRYVYKKDVDYAQIRIDMIRQPESISANGLLVNKLVFKTSRLPQVMGTCVWEK